MTTAKQLEETMRALHGQAVSLYVADGSHGTMLFPMADGRPIHVLGLQGIDLKDAGMAEVAGARARAALPKPADAFILISEAWAAFVDTPHSPRPSRHPERREALVISGATREGVRKSITILFDEKRKVVGLLDSDDPSAIAQTGGFLDSLAGPLFDPDAQRWVRYLDERMPGWRQNQQEVRRE